MNIGMGMVRLIRHLKMAQLFPVQMNGNLGLKRHMPGCMAKKIMRYM